MCRMGRSSFGEGPVSCWGALETFAGLTGLRINLAVDCFRLRPLAFGGLLGFDASVAGRFRSARELALFDRP